MKDAGVSMPGLEFSYVERLESFPGTAGYWNHQILVTLPGQGWALMDANLVRDYPNVAVADLRNIFGHFFGYSPIFV